jgi:hypothetical protein
LNGLLEEYGFALRAEANDHSGKLHMRRSWRLAGEIHDQLNGSNTQLAELGCDATPLLSS